MAVLVASSEDPADAVRRLHRPAQRRWEAGGERLKGLPLGPHHVAVGIKVLLDDARVLHGALDRDGVQHLLGLGLLRRREPRAPALEREVPPDLALHLNRLGHTVGVVSSVGVRAEEREDAVRRHSLDERDVLAPAPAREQMLLARRERLVVDA